MTVTAPPATPYAGITIPCTSCLHEPVCYLKREIPANPNVLAEPMILGPGLRLVTTGVRIECEHQLSPAADPEPIRREHGGESWRTKPEPVPEPSKRHQSHRAEEDEKAKRAAAAVAALERHGGDRRAAAAELGMRPNAFALVIKFADRRVAQPDGATA